MRNLGRSRFVLAIDSKLHRPSEPVGRFGVVRSVARRAGSPAHPRLGFFAFRTVEFRAGVERRQHRASYHAGKGGGIKSAPLAIELAAASAASLGVEEVAAHLDDRFDLLSGGRRTALPRHQTLRGTALRRGNHRKTKMVKSKGETVSLNYRMHENAGSWQISDIYLDGSISQLAVQRSEFHAILQREGVDGLIMALSRKVDLLTRAFAKSS